MATDGYAGAATADTVLPLMAVHVCAAATCWLLLPALAAPRTEGSRRETALQ